MRASTSIKLFIAGIFCIFFAGFILRAAMRLASAAMHSFFILGLIAVIGVWIFMSARRSP